MFDYARRIETVGLLGAPEAFCRIAKRNHGISIAGEAAPRLAKLVSCVRANPVEY